MSKLANIQKILYRVRQHDNKVSELYADIQKQNSIRVKQNLFRYLGIELQQVEIEFYGKIAQHEYEKNRIFVEHARILLENLFAANNKSGFFERVFFEKKMAELWFNVTYNCCAFGFFSLHHFNSSLLSYHKPLSVVEKAKFITKSIFL